MDPVAQVLICIAVGLVTGAVSALCGVGGGIIMVPAFVYILGLDQKQAVATSLVAIVLTAIAATTKNSGHGLVEWKVSIFTGLSAGVMAFIAAGYLKHLSNIALTRLFGVLVIVLGIQMLAGSFIKPKAKPSADSPPAAAVNHDADPR